MEFKSIGFLYIWIACVLISISPAWSIDRDCDYYQHLNPGVTYYVYNKEYPNFYRGQHECRWIAIADPRYIVELKCDLNIPNSQGCAYDKVLISTTGHPTLIGATTYCGTGKVTAKSVYNNITIGLQTTYWTSGGNFLCNMTTIKNNPPCECGWRNTRRIVGGEETGIHEFPSMAALLDLTIKEVTCGATIIAEKYALTAAHCLITYQPTAVALLVGDHDISSGAETPATKRMIIDRFIRHPSYDPNKNINDIAIIVTRDRIQYNFAVGPICLPFKFYSQAFTDQDAQLLGWGTTEFTGPKSPVLLKTTVKVVSPYECWTKAQGNSDQICTFAQGHDSCQADSGGPALWQDVYGSYRDYLIGIISSGLGCATNVPSINTRVTSYLQWIQSVTPDVQYCLK